MVMTKTPTADVGEQFTAFIPSWKRQKNVHLIISALRDQTANPRIVVVNNGEPFECDCDAMWQAPLNAGPFFKFLVATFYDGWLYFNDDDIMPFKDDLILSLRDLALETAAEIVGARARDIHAEPPHYANRPDTDGWTNNVKMAVSLMHRRTLSKVRIPPYNMPKRCDDIHVSLEVSRGAKVLYVDNELTRGFTDLPAPYALSGQKNHYKERGRYAGDWMVRNLGELRE